MTPTGVFCGSGGGAVFESVLSCVAVAAGRDMLLGLGLRIAPETRQGKGAERRDILPGFVQLRPIGR